jgi:oxaloacetate decarboxylase (Na+ extruding) subunit gamma
MEVTIISQGLDLMLYGMGTVFAFLTLLVGITHAMSASVNKWASADAEAVSDHKSPVITSVDSTIVTAIQAALDQHRGR